MIDSLPSTGTGIDPLAIGIALLLLGLGAGAVVWARRKRGAMMVALLPLVFGLFLFSGASATPAEAATCPPAACVADPVFDTYSTELHYWFPSGGDGGDLRNVALTEEDVNALFVFPELANAATVVAHSEGTNEVIPVPDDAWFIVEDEGTQYLQIKASVFDNELEIVSWAFVYTAPDSCGVVHTWTIESTLIPG